MAFIAAQIINAFTLRTQRVTGFVFRKERSHFVPEFITDLPPVTYHLSLPPSEITIIY